MVVCQYFIKGDCRFGDRCRNEHPGSRAGGFGGQGVGPRGGNRPVHVCQHFLKGNCWYGDSCKFAHVRTDTGGFGGQPNFGRQTFSQGTFGADSEGGTFNRNQNRFGVLSSVQQSTFGGRQQQPTTEAVTTPAQIQQTVQRDFETWDTSKQWPLSCYAYYKEEPCLPGLVDFSPEEIRLEAYNSNASGKATAYQQGLTELLNRNKQRRMELKRMQATQLQTEIRSAQSMLSTSPTSMRLEPNRHPQSPSQSASIFGVSSSMGQSQGLFSTAGQPSGVFGSPSTAVKFGENPLSPGSSQPAGQMSFESMGSSSATPGLFGSKVTSQPPTTDLFGTTSSSLGTGLFGTQSTAGTDLLGAQSSLSTGLFGATNQPGGAQATGTSVFGAPTLQPGLANQGPTNVFGNPTQSATGGQLSPVAASTSSLKCSEEDIAAFKANSFVLGKIPECPPPPELCV